MTHARLSPSSRYRWRLCPGSVREIERYEGDGKSSPSAIDGTHSHTLLEYCLKRTVDPHSCVGMVMDDHEGMFAIDRDRADRVKVAVDYVRQRQQELGPTCKVFTEKHVDPAPLLGRDDMHGTVDIHLIAGKTLEIIDYKDGMNPVEAKDNPQMQQYLAGILAEYMKEGDDFPFDGIRLTIIQPKLAFKGMPAVSSHDMHIAEFLSIHAALIIESAATDDPEAPLVAGEAQCKYCPHSGNCKAAVSFSLASAGIKFDDLNVAKQAAETPTNEMTDQQLREMIEAAPLLRKMLEAAEDEALRRIQNGRPVDGLKVVRGIGRRQWNAEDEAVEARLKRTGIPKSEIWKVSIISPAQLEKLRWTKRDGTEKQLSPKQIAAIESEIVGKSEGKLTVVPEADKRAAVEFGNLGEMFAPVVPAEVAVEPLPSWLS